MASMDLERATDPYDVAAPCVRRIQGTVTYFLRCIPWLLLLRRCTAVALRAQQIPPWRWPHGCAAMDRGRSELGAHVVALAG